MKLRTHFDYWLMMCIVGAFNLMCFGCLLWGSLLVLMQVFGWLKFGEWQSVPLSAAFMTKAGQASVRVFGTDVQPLGFVPAWGIAETAPDIAWRIAGQRMVGVATLLTWVLDTPFVLWLGAIAGVSFTFAAAAKAESTALVDR